jgi:hypothetical protein
LEDLEGALIVARRESAPCVRERLAIGVPERLRAADPELARAQLDRPAIESAARLGRDRAVRPAFEVAREDVGGGLFAAAFPEPERYGHHRLSVGLGAAEQSQREVVRADRLVGSLATASRATWSGAFVSVGSSRSSRS